MGVTSDTEVEELRVLDVPATGSLPSPASVDELLVCVHAQGPGPGVVYCTYSEVSD